MEGPAYLSDLAGIELIQNMQCGFITTLIKTYRSEQHGPFPDLCILRSEERAHIGGKRFFEESLKAEYWASELFFFL